MSTFTLSEIGEKLKIARDGLGLSLSQIHERTRIPYSHLQALENGQVDDLPEPVYVSGFIKRYAENVGLDGQQLADAYRDTLSERPGNNGRFAFLQRGPKEDSPLMPAPSYNNRITVDEGQPNPLKTGLFGSVFVILTLCLAIFLFSRPKNSDQQDQSFFQLKESQAKISAIDTNNNQTVPPEPSENNNAKEPPAQNNDAHIALTANQHVWVEVKAMSSEEALYTGFLESGDRREYADSQGLRVRVGNGKSLSVEINGKLEAFGNKADKIERTFLAKNAQEPKEAVAAKTATNASSLATKPATPTGATASKHATTTGTASKVSHHPESAATRQYIPGESIGNGTKTIDVPYRYSE